MFEMPASSLLSLLSVAPASGGAILPSARAGNGEEQVETGGFSQVLALLPTVSAKPGPVMDAEIPAPVAETMLAATTPALPEGGKILPVALPRMPAPQIPSAIPAGIMAILPPPAEQPVSPVPAPMVSQPIATAMQLKSILPKAPQAEPALPRQAEAVPEESESKGPVVRHAKTKPDHMALLRSAVALTARKVPTSPSAAIEAPVREERVSEQPLPASVDVLPGQPIVVEVEATVSLPVTEFRVSGSTPIDEAPEAPAPTVVVAPTAAPLSHAKAWLPDGPLRQQPLLDQQISAPAEPARANPHPAASAPKIELPITSLAPPRTPLVPATALVIEPDAAIPADLTIAMPLRVAMPRRAAVAASAEHTFAPTAPTNFSAPSEPLLRASPIAVQRQTEDAAATPAQVLYAPTTPSPLAAPDISAPAASPIERPADFTQIVDRLIAARDLAGSGQSQLVHVSLSHAEFGKVSLRFSHDDGALSVALSSPDPDFARAAQIAAPSQQPAADANTGGSNNQPQSRSGDNPGFNPNGQPQANSNGSSGQRQPAPEFRTARGEPARQPDTSDDEPAADRRHRFA